MPLNENALNVAANAVAGVVGFLSLHSAEPNASGSNEISGGSPAYARKAVSWDAASEGDVKSSAAVEFDVPAGTTISHVGFWSAATGGTFYGYGVITQETYGAQGTYLLDTATIDFD